MKKNQTNYRVGPQYISLILLKICYHCRIIKKTGLFFFKKGWALGSGAAFKKTEPSALKQARDITADFRLQTDSNTMYHCRLSKSAQIGTFTVGFWAKTNSDVFSRAKHCSRWPPQQEHCSHLPQQV
jgi:hypothetical protein